MFLETEAAMTWLADLVLAIHFGIAAFIAAGLVLIPWGGARGWAWVRWRRLRLVHAGLMVFVAAEAVVGMTCPLTLVEAYLRGAQAPESFWGYWLERLLYWNLPPSFFLVLYGLCAMWVVMMWFLIPRESNSGIEDST
jgi:hypothetical protein